MSTQEVSQSLLCTISSDSRSIIHCDWRLE